MLEIGKLFNLMQKSYKINKNRFIEFHVIAEVFDASKSPSPKITSEISLEVNKPINEPSDVLRRSTKT